MFGTLICNISALFISLFGSKKKRIILFYIALLIPLIFLSLRYNFGNDLPGYEKKFYSIALKSWDNVIKDTGNFEVGYSILNKLFGKFDFNVMLTVLSILTISSTLFLIKKCTPANYYFLSLYIFLFSPVLMLIQSSAVRQTIAISIFCFSIKYLFERKLIEYCLLIILAIQFHSSAIILLPLFFVLKPSKITFAEGSIYLIIFYLMNYLFGSILSQLFLIFSSFIPRYMVYFISDSNQQSSFVSLLFRLSILIGLVLYGKGEKGYTAIAIRGSFWAFIFQAVGIHLPLAARLGFYFEPFVMVSIPYIIYKAKIGYFKIILIVVIMAYYLKNFFLFFSPESIYSIPFSEYTTIFSK